MIEQTYTLTQAAKRLGLKLTTLRGMVSSGMIEAVKLPGGELALTQSTVDQTITKDQFAHLAGRGITVSKAIEKYTIAKSTVHKWIKKGFITILVPGYRMQIDEADMAYCAAVYRKRKGGQGKPILDGSGQPYRLKNPQAAQYRREYRQRQAKAKKNKKHIG